MAVLDALQRTLKIDSDRVTAKRAQQRRIGQDTRPERFSRSPHAFDKHALRVQRLLMGWGNIDIDPTVRSTVGRNGLKRFAQLLAQRGSLLRV
ncbi:hypothetical protein D5038_14150 [Verminephrobacter aporrectodeae subsp. tuberculatae]|nr:hypothetical protein [Verminephrobacter aporrectodeae subsp. tuberculatae]